MSLPTAPKTSDSATPDSFDAHIIPAETAARKDREGNQYKKVPKSAEGTDSINTTSGYTVDTEGLANNYAMEPEMYAETPGDLSIPDDNTSQTYDYTIIDTFDSPQAAETAALKIKEAGVSTSQMSILGQDYQDKEHVQGQLTWKNITQSDGLAATLVDMGIAHTDALQHAADISKGKFMLLVTGSVDEVGLANQILHDIGHKSHQEIAS